MKKVLILILLMTCAITSKAQSGFFFGADVASANFWTSSGIEYVNKYVNKFLKSRDIPIGLGGRVSYDIMRFREEGSTVELNSDDRWGLKRLFGFHARDLLGHLNGNVKFGWMGAYSPIGFYIHAGYEYRDFMMRFSYFNENQEYQIGSFTPGLGIRISPNNFYDSDSDVDILMEAGTYYNVRSYFKGPFDNDKNQLNGGMTYSVALGIDRASFSTLLGFEWVNQDLFNRKYGYSSTDYGMVYPYHNLSSNLMSFFVTINYGF